MLTDGILGGNFARTQSSVKLDQSVRLRTGGIPLDGGRDHFVALKQLFEGAVGAVAQSTQKHRRGKLTLSVYVDPQRTLRVLLKFQPGAAVGNDRGFVHLFPRLIRFGDVVDAGRTDELGDDHALRAVDDKGTVLRHQRQIAHKDVLFEDLVLDLVDEAHLYAQGKGVSSVAVAALLFVVLRALAEFVVEEIQLEVVGEVGYRRKILQNLGNAFADKGVVALLLDLHKVGNVDDFVDRTEFSALGFTVLVNG